MSAPSDTRDPQREELDKLHQMLKENKARCAESRTRMEARLIAEKDHEAQRDQDLMEIREKFHDLVNHDSCDNETSDESIEILLEAVRHAHQESLAAIADFAEENRAQREAQHKELCRVIGGNSSSS